MSGPSWNGRGDGNKRQEIEGKPRRRCPGSRLLSNEYIFILKGIFILKLNDKDKNRAALFARALLTNCTRLVDNRTRGINIRQ